MILANSLWRKVLATVVVAVGFVWLYEVTILDSRFAAQGRTVGDVAPPPIAGARLLFSATAYCKGSTTASGVNVRSGIAAADPDLLPVGSVVQVDAPGARYDGIYTVGHRPGAGPASRSLHVELQRGSVSATRRSQIPPRLESHHSSPGLNRHHVPPADRRRRWRNSGVGGE